MRCLVGVHTRKIEVQLSDEDYSWCKLRHVAKIGRRSWFMQEHGGGILIERSQVGCSPDYRRLAGRVVLANNNSDIVVRCGLHEREIEHPRAGQMFIPMPPHHLWPWMRDHRSLVKYTPRQWRELLVAELNARVRSATLHHVDMPSDLPAWVDAALTERDRAELMANREICV